VRPDTKNPAHGGFWDGIREIYSKSLYNKRSCAVKYRVMRRAGELRMITLKDAPMDEQQRHAPAEVQRAVIGQVPSADRLRWQGSPSCTKSLMKRLSCPDTGTRLVHDDGAVVIERRRR